MICVIILLRWFTTLAMIACQTSVLIARAKMTQVTPRTNENHFSTRKALKHFGIRSNSFKVPSNKNMSKKLDKHK